MGTDRQTPTELRSQVRNSKLQRTGMRIHTAIRDQILQDSRKPH